MKSRTIYFDDARHYYYYVYDPPMKLEEAWMAVDQIAGTAVDTLVYGVACEGLFYPSKIGKTFREPPFRGEYSAPFWRAWANMQSLIDRGLDPLQVLVERAHEKGLDFIASMRMGNYHGMKPEHMPSNGGRGLAEPDVREYLFSVFEEVLTEYPIDGIELDFSAYPAMEWFFHPDEGRNDAHILTDMVNRLAELVRQDGKNRTIGARILPHRAMNDERGLEIHTWLEKGMLDFAVPMCYQPSLLDPDLPLDWIVEAAHAHDTSVFGFLHPARSDESRRFTERKHASTEMLRAAASNYFDRGVDGLYTWFLPWPFGPEQLGFLNEMGDPDTLRKGNKQYHVRRRNELTAEIGYDAPLPLEIPFGYPGKLHEIEFYVSDDLEKERNRVQRVTLQLNIIDMVTADRLTVLLNGQTLEGEHCRRSYSSLLEPYVGQWLEFDLVNIWPRHGQNILALSLEERPPHLESTLRVDDVELIIEYGAFPTGLSS